MGEHLRGTLEGDGNKACGGTSPTGRPRQLKTHRMETMRQHSCEEVTVYSLIIENYWQLHPRISTSDEISAPSKICCELISRIASAATGRLRGAPIGKVSQNMGPPVILYNQRVYGISRFHVFTHGKVKAYWNR